MKKTLLQILKIAGFLALGVLLLYFAFRGIALEALAKTLKEADFKWIGLSLVFLSLSFLVRAHRWTLLVEPLGFSPSFWNTYHALMVGYLSNFALPRLGEVTRCVTLGNKEKIPVDSLIGTVIVERVTDLIMLFLIMLLLLVSWMGKFGTFFSEQIFKPMRMKITEGLGEMLYFWILVLGGLALIVLLAYLFRNRLARFRMLRLQRIGQFLRGILDGLKTLYKMRRKWEYIILSFVIWFLYIMLTWVVVFALKETSSLTFVDGVFLLVIGGLGMSAPVTAGFGAFHWIVSRGLLYVYSLPLAEGGAFAILAHEPNSLYTIILGSISYVILVVSRKRAMPQHAEG